MGGSESGSESDDEYAKLIRRMNPPRVVIDNDACENATVIKVDSENKQGTLLEVVQVLTDLNLVVNKAYISSDGCWFMDVFNVTDREGMKITDESIIKYLHKSIETDACFRPSLKSSVGVRPSKEHTSIELTGPDRPGLLSEVCAVLTNLKCNIVNAEIWAHNSRTAAVVCVTDESTGCAIDDPHRLSIIKELLSNVLSVNNDSRSAKMAVSLGVTHTERRLHQMMFADRDYENVGDNKPSRPQVVLLDCLEKDYTVVMLRSKDRPKLLFDTLCTLTDMQYVVFHGTVDTGRMEAYQEYYIQHVDGLPIRSEAERQRVTQCLEAAIERRASEGLELELRTKDRVGLLSDITRIFRENGMYIRRAEISTEGGMAVDSFHVTDMLGNPVEAKAIESVCEQIGQTALRVRQCPEALSPKPPEETLTSFLLGNFLKACSFQTFGLIRSYS
ncbi:hypothetical protein QJS10_CPB22g00522 [Acorus calamus]|uniref:ACT domain-containing protein ACR n=1 Tax=Acorus calamus TaxID=4465 RepID=A0AAV9BYK2_ACOCL|nr:hypothetical protein QJS10_CPB22g00522 [Acorus calamus]